MNNNTVLEKRWKYSDNKLKDYLKVYNSINNRTQDRIQDIFNDINYTYLDLNKPISKTQKSKLIRIIEEWKEKGLLTGYFGYIANNMLRKLYISNEEMLDILLYGAFIEERSKIKEKEKNLFIDISTNLYEQGISDIAPKKKEKQWNLTWEYIWSLLCLPNVRGNVWNEYIQALMLTNYQQIKKQAMINLQQNKELNIKNDIFQNILRKQRNTYLSINDDKYSGALENEVIELGNESYLKAGKDTGTTKIRFIAEVDKHTTKMCLSLNNQIFNVDGWNTFKRYSDESGGQTEYKIYGLLKGVNLPPIDDHFHYCRSTITYQWDSLTIADELEHSKLRKILNSRVPKSIEEYRKMKYNNNSWYESILREKSTITEIKTNKDYTNMYKNKLIKKYYDFRKRDIEMTPHSLNRFIGQKNSKYKNIYTEKEFIDLMNKKTNYYEPDTNKDVKYYNKTAVILDKDNKEVISIITGRKYPKEEWVKYE